MPCRSDYLEPNRREKELQRAARLLIYLLTKLCWTPSEIKELRPDNLKDSPLVHANIYTDSQDIYCKNDWIPVLCEYLTSLIPDQLDRLVYDGKDRTARDLANWWDDHKKADREREEQERKAHQYDLGIAIKTLQKLGYHVELTRAEKK